MTIDGGQNSETVEHQLEGTAPPRSCVVAILHEKVVVDALGAELEKLRSRCNPRKLTAGSHGRDGRITRETVIFSSTFRVTTSCR